MLNPPPSSPLVRFLLQTKFVRHYAKKIIKTYKSEADGFSIYIRRETSDDTIYREIFQKRSYEKYFSPREGDTVVDAGANSGLFTLRASRLVGKSGRVIAVEPYSKSFILLERHLRTNQRHNAIALHLAVGREPGRASLNVYSSPGENSLFNRPVDSLRREVTRMGSENVEVDTLDSVVTMVGASSVDFLKIDVEGSELDILIGAVGVLKQFHPKIVAETHLFGSSADEMRFFLIRHGYAVTTESYFSDTGLLFAS